MKRVCLSILHLTFYCTFLFSQDILVDQPEKLAAKAEHLLQEAIIHKEHVGISAGLFADGKVLWSSGAGYRSLNNQSPATAQMVHRIASISKPMTAVAILQLFEKGELELDVAIQKYVPNFPKKPQGDITIRQLLQHTSGIPHYKNRSDGFSTKNYPSLEAAVDRFKDRDLVSAPGKNYHYSTYGYVLLGLIIEKVSGMPYEQYLQKHIWEPAGMPHTSVEKAGVSVQNKSGLYRINKKGKLEEDLQTDLSIKVPGGGIQSTIEDLLRFGEAILNNTLLRPETLEIMLTDPGVRDPKAGNSYAMGWFLYSKEDGNRIIGHSGGQAGTTTQLMILLDKKAVVACQSNTRGEGQWGRVFHLSWQLIDLATSPEALEKAQFAYHCHEYKATGSIYREVRFW